MGTGSGPRALPGHVGVRGADPSRGQGGQACWPPFGAGAGRGRQRFLLFLCALLALAIGMLRGGLRRCGRRHPRLSLVYPNGPSGVRRSDGDLAGWFLQVCELGCLAAMVLAREIAEVLI